MGMRDGRGNFKTKWPGPAFYPLAAMISLGILPGESAREVETEGHVYYQSARKFRMTGQEAKS